MKRVLLSITVLLVLLCGIAVAEEVSIVESGECGKNGSNLTWTLDSEGTLTISGVGEMEDYDWGGDLPWYSNHESIKTAVIKDGVTSIGASAFENCSNLDSIVIPAGLTSIGNDAFYRCSGLKYINLPNSLTEINEYAFFGCCNLTDVVIPDGVIKIGGCAFYQCSKLARICIPNSVTSIGDAAFGECSNLKKITIPEIITSIGSNLFYECNNLTDICLPENLTSIDRGAFYKCISLCSIDIPDNVTSIGEYAFEGCKSLNSIEIPDGMNAIRNSVFKGCSSLSKIVIPISVDYIGRASFYGCDSLSNITIPADAAYIGSSAFEKCSNLRRIMFLGKEMSTFEDDAIPTFSTIYCYNHSAVDNWATNNGYTCVYIDSMDLNIPISLQLPKEIRVALGRSKTVSADLFPQAVDAEIIWESSNPKIVSVENGVLTANAVGAVIITASCGNLSDQMTVTTYVPMESFELSNSELCIVRGDSVQMSIIDVQPAEATAKITWECDSGAVTIDDNGMIVAKEPSLWYADVIATSENGVKRTCRVNVYYPVTAIEFEETTYQMTVNSDIQITPHIITMDGRRCYHLVTFNSSNEAVATVDQTGCIHAVSPGTATITVAATTGVSASCIVTVAPCTHTPATDAAVPATCTATGLTEGSHCSVCDAVLVAQKVIPAKGHTTVTDAAVAATCTASGLTEGSRCSVCDEVLVAQEVVPAKGHTVVTDPLVPATHVTTGLTEGSHCSVCGDVLVVQQMLPVEEVPMMTLPAGLKTIEAEAFAGNTFICAVLSEGCETIGAGAFRDCVQLRFVEIPESVTSIDSTAFEGCGDDLIIVTVSGSEAERFANVQGITCILR